MKLVRSGTGGGIEPNGRAQDLAEATRAVLAPILGDGLAQDVANNAAMAFAFDEDEIYESDQSFAEVVRAALIQRLKHPKTYRAERLTGEMVEEAVAAVENMDSERLGKAVMGFFTAPINEHETPYVSIPEDFTPAEQTKFVDLVRQPRFVSREEQVAKLKEIIAARRGHTVRNVSRDSDYEADAIEAEARAAKTKPGTLAHSSAHMQAHYAHEAAAEDAGRRGDARAQAYHASRARHHYNEAEPRRSVVENPRRASTLNGRPSMDTRHVGRDVDPDRYKGKRGRDLDAAMDRYETFHAKRPLRAVELPHDLPTSVVPVGQVISTMYRTDKWHEDGDDEDYKHVHDNSRGGKEREYEFGKGVIAYEPAHQASKSVIATDGKRAKANPAGKPTRLPVHAPGALSLLGYCLGVFVHRFDDDEIYEINPRGCYLFCSPKGDMLALYSPDKQPDGSVGFLMIMAGGGLRVLKDGIDG